MPIDARALVDLATTTVNFAFQNAYANIPQNNSLFSQMLLTGTMGSRTVKLPINGMLARWRRFTGERVHHDLSRYMAEVEAKPYELSYGIDADEVSDNASLLQRVASLPSEIVSQAELLPRQVVTDLLLNGRTRNCFDGQFFFDTDHPVDPSGATSTALFSNYLVSTPFTSVGVNAAILAMRNLRDPSGYPLNIQLKDMRAIVAPQRVGDARAMFEMPTLANGASNPDYKLLQWEDWTELYDYPTEWYLAAVIPNAKPFIWIEREAPSVAVLDQIPASGVYERGIVRVGGKARFAEGYGMPHTIFKCIAAAS